MTMPVTIAGCCRDPSRPRILAGAGASGEMRFGAARGLRDFVYLKTMPGWVGLNPGEELSRGALGTAGQPRVDGVRESINRYAHAGAAESLEIKTTQLGLRSELLGAVAVACQEAAYQPA